MPSCSSRTAQRTCCAGAATLNSSAAPARLIARREGACAVQGESVGMDRARVERRRCDCGSNAGRGGVIQCRRTRAVQKATRGEGGAPATGEAYLHLLRFLRCAHGSRQPPGCAATLCNNRGGRKDAGLLHCAPHDGGRSASQQLTWRSHVRSRAAYACSYSAAT
jgi:hypothetical protein